MSYNYRGEEIASGGSMESGYTMQSEPAWEQVKCILAHDKDGGEANVGAVIDATEALKASDYIPVMGRNTLRITMPVVSDTVPANPGLCFYDAYKAPMKMYGTAYLWGRGTGDERVQTVEVYVPDGAAYFRTTYWSDSSMEANPGTAAFTYTFTPGRWRDHAITHEMPVNKGMENAIRRVRQLTDIRWTPKVRVPRYCLMNSSEIHYLDWCEPGREYKGIPYSGSGQGENWTYGQINANSDAGKWGYYMMFVGLEISPETFVTAARYPNSIFGERANRTTVNYDASPYGDVCSALVSYALGLKSPIWPIGQFPTNASYGKNYFIPLGALGTAVQPEGIRLGDVFHNSGHVAIITDIVRDTAGTVTAVEISEATTVGKGDNGADGDWLGGMCRRKMLPINELIVSYWATNYLMYRFISFTRIGYTPSKYVDTGGEGCGMPVEDLPCIPYLGNKARYKAGYIRNSKVLIGAEGFTTLVVTKDGAEFGQFPCTGLTEVVTGFSEVGSYKAYLLNAAGKRTMACEWTVE